MTQAALAREAGVSDAYVARLELGRVNPPKLGTIAHLGKALGLDPSELDELVDLSGRNRAPAPGLATPSPAGPGTAAPLRDGGAANAEIAELIDRLIRSLALRHGLPMRDAVKRIADATGYSVATVYFWRQGRFTPTAAALQALARFGDGPARAAVGPEWTEQLRAAARRAILGADVEGARGTPGPSAPAAAAPTLRATLPARPAGLIGRDNQLTLVLARLQVTSPLPLVVLPVSGIGGVGKTALVVEAAYQLAEATPAPGTSSPAFAAIVFVSADDWLLTPYGLVPIPPTLRGIQTVAEAFAQTLGRPEIAAGADRPTWQDALRTAARSLPEPRRTLVILDHVDAIPDHELRETLQFLGSLELAMHVVMTHRERRGGGIHLDGLGAEAGPKLVAHLAEARGLTLTQSQAKRIVRGVGGIPLAIQWALDRVEAGVPPEAVVEEITRADSPLVAYVFGDVVAGLNDAERAVLRALAGRPEGLSLADLTEALRESTSPDCCDHAVARLLRHALLRRDDASHRYSVHPLAADLALEGFPS